MKRILSGLLLACAVSLAFVATASAHTMTSASIGCACNGNGGSQVASQVTVNYQHFTPINGQRETIVATFTNGVIERFVPPADQGTYPLVGPTVPNGTALGVTLKSPEQTLTVAPKVLNCQPVPPPPPTCTPPAVLREGKCVTPLPPPPPPPAPPAPPTPPASVPAPPPPSVTPPTPPPPAPPVPTPPHHHPKLPPPCVKVKASKVHASIGPQGLVKGAAMLKASGPRSVSAIRVTIYDDYGNVASSLSVRGHRLVRKLDVTASGIWGIFKPCGCTYGLRHRIVVRFYTRCGFVDRVLTYKNLDGPTVGTLKF